jgi:hypothetical protein
VEGGGSKGAEGESAKCQRLEPLFAYKYTKYLREVNMLAKITAKEAACDDRYWG